jgi:hypothetical protein
MTAPATTATQNIWLGAYLLAHGLELDSVRAFDGPRFKGEFIIADPHGRAAVLTRAFREDTTLQRLIGSRSALIDALSVVRARRVCTVPDVALAMRGNGAATEKER